ncbi:hypothetical protein [Bdellovibrio sp. HCB288]|uniref:hypothetical protein n=1 Tax=Bdellovibrio sp. HCB288 TaxID=3394355 RepID=UPI0039B67C2D
MVQLWVIIGLALSAIAVSVLGAAFSIAGLGKLFSGAVLAVWLMAGALELAKFVAAAYLHQTWKSINLVMKSYMVICVVVLSGITSMGIFGFLSDAYLISASTLEAESIKIDKLHNEQRFANAEIDRINRGIEEIPAGRITRKLQARAEAEPLIQQLKAQVNTLEGEIAQAKIKLIDEKQKVGPLIYISKAFNMEIDNVVKYLIMVFVAVFDPLAICLVIALSDAVVRRGRKDQVTPTASTTAPLKMRFAEKTDKSESGSHKEVG